MLLLDSPIVHRLSYTDPLYPSLLKEIPSFPKTLYYMGKLGETLFDKCISIVGSRDMSPYGERVLDSFFEDLAGTGITVVSGFMCGVDQHAHTLALKYGLPTVAVLPYGIDHVPDTHTRSLRDGILSSGGLVLSEYAGEDPPRKWMFHKRNRIVAGLSFCVLVIEAGINSGSLITSNYAHKFGRKVYAVPGNIFDPGSKGITQILASFAKAVDCGCDIVNNSTRTLTQVLTDTKAPSPDTDSINACILGSLTTSGMCIDELSVLTSIEIPVLNSKLTQLQVKGLVKEWRGKFYAC